MKVGIILKFLNFAKAVVNLFETTMAIEKAKYPSEQDTMFLEENRQRLVKSIADQIYNTIVSKSASQKGKYKKTFFNAYGRYPIKSIFRTKDIFKLYKT